MKNASKKLSRISKCALVFVLATSTFQGVVTTHASEPTKIAIGKDQVSGKHAPDHAPELAVDGDKNTYYQTPLESSSEDHYRYLEIDLNGLYEVSEIKVFNLENTYNHYQIYASNTGSSYDKIIFKDDNAIPSLEEGTTHTFETPVTASKLRVNLSYNSAGMQGNLAEIEVYGNKIGDASISDHKIEVPDFDETKWKSEYDKFASDAVYAKEKTENELSAMVGRVIGEKWKDHFIFEMKDFGGNDMYEISNGANGTVIIRGNNGVSLASGWNYYLRYYCKVDYNPMFVSNLNMPETLPPVEKIITKETQYDVRYALNFCTYSYTMAFWNWNEYEAFLDWAAMSGINLMLDIVGQEEIIRRTLNEYGYTDEEIKEYITGPGYFAWYYMQNMTSYGGPLPDNWFEERVELGRQMHDRMQTLGITPALSGFSGMVPKNFRDKNPDAVIVEQGGWPYDGAFERPDMLRVYVNEEEADYFDQLADTFYQAQKDVFGDVTNYYAVDPFHEGGKTGDMDMTTVYATVQNKMLEHDPEGIWVIQQWSGALNDKKLSGLTQKDHALILDLSSEFNSYANVMERNEIPWVWNMIHAFGGKLGLEANVGVISQDIPKAFDQYSFMQGIGMSMESLERCPMIYELLWDMAWTKDPIDPMEWGEAYLQRRYGKVDDDLIEAWSIMLTTVYDNRSNDIAESLTNARPTENFNSTSSWGRGSIPYDTKEFEKVLKIYLDHYDEYKDNECFIYDFADITRQVLSNASIDYHKLMMNAYRANDIALFNEYSQHFLDLIQLQNDVLDTSDYFQTGTWLEEARSMIADADDWTKDLFEFNARSLITTWGGKRTANYGGLRDYSYRSWAGITEDFYLQRWKIWVDNYRMALENHTSPKSVDWFNWEWAWTNRKSDEGYAYPAKSQSDDDLGKLAQQVYDEFSITNIENYMGNQENDAYGNILLGKKAVVDQQLSSDEITQLTDGNADTGWIGTNEEWPVSFTYDLAGTASIDSISFTMKPIVAGGIEVSYQVEVFTEGAWKLVKEDQSQDLPGKITIDYTGLGEKVRFSFDSSSKTAVPEFKEFEVYGKIIKERYKNVLKGLPAITDKNGTRTEITDDSIDTRWTQTTNAFPATVTISLETAAYVDELEVYFEKAGLIFRYTVEVTDEKGQVIVVQDMSENEVEMADHYVIPVNQKIKQVKINFISRSTAGNFYLAAPCLREVRGMQKTDTDEIHLPLENIALNKTAIKKKAGTDEWVTAPKLSDGDYTTKEEYTTANYGFVPAEYAIDLGKERFVDSANIHFEKAGLRFKFQIFGEKADGSRILLLDMSENTKNMEKIYTVDVKEDIQKVVVDLQERCPDGSFYLAASSIFEIEVFSTPENLSPQAEFKTNEKTLEELHDEDSATSVNFASGEDKTIYIAFTDEKDISALGIAHSTEEALRYTLSYKDADGNWIMLVDQRDNIMTSKFLAESFKKAVLAKEFKLELMNDTAQISDIYLYKKNFTDELLSYVEYLLNTLKYAQPGEYAGNYEQVAYDTFMKKVNDLKSADLSILNSKDIEGHKQELNTLYLAYKKSYISIDRNDLLSALNGAEALLNLASCKNMAFLQDAYDAASLIYDTYKVKQTEIDDATVHLNESIGQAMNLLSLKDHLEAQLSIAFKAVAEAVVGDKNGNVSQESLDALKRVIEEIEDVKETTIDESGLHVLISKLETAISEFQEATITVDKTVLLHQIAAIELLQEKDYTKDSWEALREVYEAAVVLSKQDAGLSEVNTMIEQLDIAVQALKKVDRDELSEIIKQAEMLKEIDYTAETWEHMIIALNHAKEVYGKTSINQNELDEAKTALVSSIQALKKVDRTALAEIIKQAEALLEERYTTSTWQNVAIALAKANIILENETATAEDIARAEATLSASINALAKRADAWMFTQLEEDTAKYEAMKDDFTAEEFAEMAEALAKANDLLAKGNEDISQQEAASADLMIIVAAVNLNKAADTETLRNNLQQVMDIANAILESDEITDVRPGKAEALRNAVTVGQGLMDEGTTDLAVIRNAITSIEKATMELWEIVDKEALKALIEQAEGIGDNYTEASKAELAEAIAQAEAALDKDAAVQEVSDAYARLADAIANMQPEVLVNKDALANQIKIAEDVMANIDNYIASTVKGLKELLEEANAVKDNANATQAEVDAITAVLTEANMKARTKADKEALQEAVDNASAIDLDLYTEESGTTLKAALAEANAVLADEAATQEEVDAALNAVDTAVGKMQKVTDITPDNGNSNTQDHGNGSTQAPNNGASTGDGTNAGALLGLLAISGCAVLTMTKKKKEEE